MIMLRDLFMFGSGIFIGASLKYFWDEKICEKTKCEQEAEIIANNFAEFKKKVKAKNKQREMSVQTEITDEINISKSVEKEIINEIVDDLMEELIDNVISNVVKTSNNETSEAEETEGEENDFKQIPTHRPRSGQLTASQIFNFPSSGDLSKLERDETMKEQKNKEIPINKNQIAIENLNFENDDDKQSFKTCEEFE